MGRYDALLPKPPALPGANPQQTAVRRMRGRYDYLLPQATAAAAPPEPESSAIADVLGKVAKPLETLTYPLTLPKRGVDWLAREGSRLQGLPVSDEETTGSLLRSALGLNPVDNPENNTIPARLLGRGVEEATNLATDPLTWALPAGKIGRVAGAAFAPIMLHGALESGSHAAREIQQNGFTPQAAEDVLGTTIGAGFGYLGAKHALTGGAHGTVAPEVAPDVAAPAPALPNVWTGEAPAAPKIAGPAPIAAGWTPPVTHFTPPEQTALTPESLGWFDRLVAQDRMPEPGAMPETVAEAPERRAETRRAMDAPVDVERRLAADPRQVVADAVARGDSPRKALVDTLGMSPSKAGRALRELEVPTTPEPVAAEARAPHEQAIDATLQQMETTLRHADPARRVLVRGEGDRVEGGVSVPSVKGELGLDHLTQGPTAIADAIRRDGDNPLYLEVKRAAEAKDPFGFMGQAEEVEHGGGTRTLDGRPNEGVRGAARASEADGASPGAEVRQVPGADVADRPPVRELPPPVAEARTQTPGRPEAVEPARKFSSTQVDLPEAEARGVRDLAQRIPDSDLAEDGREATPHVTVKYGIHADDVEPVRRALADEPPVTVRLGKTSVFPAKEGAPYDVVKLDVDSPDLHRLNAKIAAAVDTTDTHPQYQPHATVAYVKPGLGAKYAGDASMSGRTMTLDRISFSDRSGNVHEIPLRGAAEPELSDSADRRSSDRREIQEPVSVDQRQGERRAQDAGFNFGDEAPAEQRAGERRVAPEPVEADRRRAERRTTLARELQLDESHPAVDRVIDSEDRAARSDENAARSEIDEMTGAYSRDAYQREVKSGPRPAAVSEIDVAGAGAMNKKYGEPYTDAVLGATGRQLVKFVGDRGKVFRKGGDEFVIHWFDEAEGTRAHPEIARALGEAVISVESDGKVVAQWQGVDHYDGFGKRFEEASAALYAKKPTEGQPGYKQLPASLPERIERGRAEVQRVGAVPGGSGVRGSEGAPEARGRDQADELAPTGSDPKFSTEKKPAAATFFSALQRAATDKRAPGAASGNDWSRFLSDPKRGVKADELKWTGLDDFLRERGTKKVTKQEISDFLEQNNVEVKEVTLGANDGASREPAIAAEKALRDALMDAGHSPAEAGRLAQGVIDGDGEGAAKVALGGDPDGLVKELADARRSAYSEQTKFSQYTLPGGENYRELLMTLPVREATALPDGYRVKETEHPSFARWQVVDRDGRNVANGHGGTREEAITASLRSLNANEKPGAFRSGHYDEPNILAHVRFNERTDAAGKKVLFIEEVQSDFAQQGRRKGFGNGEGQVPSAPFVEDTNAWSSLAMKRMLRWAAENGFDRVAWTKGEQQAERYDLSKQVDAVRVTRDNVPNGSNTSDLYVKPRGGDWQLMAEGLTHEQMVEHVGKDLADKIASDEIPVGDRRDYSGVDLKVGGEGMKGFYDQILPAVANKLGKKWGAKVGETAFTFAERDKAAFLRDLDKYTVVESRHGGYKVYDEAGQMVDGFDTKPEAQAWIDRARAGAIAVDEPTTRVHSMDITPEMRRSVTEDGQPLFKPGAAGAATAPDRSAVLSKLKELFPGQKIEDLTRGAGEPEAPFRIRTKSGKQIFVQPTGSIEFSASAAARHGLDETPFQAGEVRAVGSTQSVGPDVWVKIVDEGKLPHEIGGHVFLDNFATPSERGFAEKKWRAQAESEGRSWDEVMADDYNQWFDDRKTVNGAARAIFERIKDFFYRVAGGLGIQTKGGLFREIESGRPFSRDKVIRPIPPGAKPGEKYSTQPAATSEGQKPLGRPMTPEEAPRVEAKAAAVGEVDPSAKLSRDEPRSWKSLDPKIRQRLRDVQTDPMEEARLYNRAKKGNIDDVDVQTLDALVAGKREIYDETRQKLQAAQAEGRETGPENVEYLKATFDRVTAEYAKAARSDVEAGTKLARALAARARVMDAAGKSTPDQFLKKVFREMPGVTDKQAGELLKIFQEKPRDLQDALHAALQPGKIDKFLEAWKAGLVSALPTQGANVLGNVGEQVMRLGETATSALLDPLLGGPRTRLHGEARMELAGAMKGAQKSWGKLGEDLLDIVKLAPEHIDLTQPIERQTGAIGGKTGRAIRVPFRLLSAFDDFFKGIGGEAELHKLAFRAAKGNRAEMAKILEDPPKDMLEAIERSKLSRTFQDPNKGAAWLQGLRSEHKWMHAVIPFLATPANIAKITLERSPAGFVKAYRAFRDYKAAAREGAPAETVERLKGEATDALARPMMGTMIMATFAMYAKSGGMTGSGPTDPKDRHAIEQEGWQPYSFILPSKDGKKIYVPFNRFEPVSSLLGFAADMAESGDVKDGNDLLAKGIGSVIQNLTSKTYLRGIADAAAVIRDPMQFGSEYAAGMVGSLVPNIVAKAAQAADDKVRDARAGQPGLAGAVEHIGKTLESRIPGLSVNLPERRSGTGKVVERKGNAFARFASPVTPSESTADLDFAQKLVDLEAVPSTSRRSIKVKGHEITLTDAEYNIVQQYDERTTERLKRMVQDPAFEKLPEEEQKKQIDEAYSKARSQARSRLLASPGLAARAAKQIRASRSVARQPQVAP